MIRIGFLSVAHMHAISYRKALQNCPETVVVGVYDEDGVRGQWFAETMGIPWVDDLDQLLSQVDATIICAENVRHRFFVEASASRGIPMLCEKPLATTRSDALAMLAAVEQAHVPLYLALPVRFVPAVDQLVAAVHQGQIGRPIAVWGTNHGQIPPGWFLDPKLSGGGAVTDHTPHVVDIMRWLVQSEVSEVYAEIDTRRGGSTVDDTAVLALRFDNGVFATLDPSWSRPKSFPTWGDVTLEVVGSDGVLSLDAFRQHLHLYVDDGVSHRYQGFGDSMDEAMIASFVEAIQTDRRSVRLAEGRDGLKALEVTLAAYESARRQAPVRISDVE